jgi:hypothetical protein
VVILERGACPICELEFDEQADFRVHLAEAHDLHDDDGTESEFGSYVIQPVAPAVPPPSALHEEARQRREEAPEMGRPLGLVALVVALLGLLAGVITYTGAQDEPTSDEAADVPVPSTASTVAASAGDAPGGSTPDSTTAPSAEAGGASMGATGTPGTAGTGGTAAPAPALNDGTTPAPASAPSPTSTPTTLAPATSTTAPAADFAPPTASDARITSCARDRDLWQVTYTWSFSGGRLWKPLSSYTSLGGGRYQHVVAVPRRDDTAITAVAVTDPNGARHSVPLRPALSSASC